jgi:Protein of unknown function (DUF2961)
MIIPTIADGAPRIGGIRSRSITAENQAGEKGGGGQAASPLGPGRKGRPRVVLPPGETVVLADIEGPGIIRHVWITVPEQTDASPFVLRSLVLRMHWDDEADPSVEVPLGDFFCNGFGRRCLVSSMPIVVAPAGGMNCYFPMPFTRSARIALTSDHPDDVDVFFQIDYHLVDELAGEVGYFHAQWRRQPITEPSRDFVVVDDITGAGAYVGTYLGVAVLERYWWGEGEFKFYIDGDTDWPTICGTGVEDYFGGAWAFQDELGGQGRRVITYTTAYLGCPHHSTTDDTRTSPYADIAVPMFGMYRWHLPDPIHFERDLAVTVQQIGHDGKHLFERRDDVTSVAYWYQREPHHPFPQLPDMAMRTPR